MMHARPFVGRLGCVAGLVLSLFVPSVHADEPTTMDEARKHFERGLELEDARNWDAALAEFLLSKKLYPSYLTTINIGLCYRGLKRFEEALTVFEEVGAIEDLRANERGYIERQINELRRLVGFVSIRVSEPDAEIIIDDRKIGKALRNAPIRVSMGSHVVRVLKNGFSPHEARVEVAGEQSLAVSADLLPLTQSGWLKVDELSDRALDVVVDGIVIGQTPFRGLVSPGEHVVYLRGERYWGTLPTVVSVRLNQVSPVLLSAEELRSTLRVFAKPDQASISIDGVFVARGYFGGAVHPGEHRVEVSFAGYSTRVAMVSLVADETKLEEISLLHPEGPPRWWKESVGFVEAQVDLGVVPSLGGDIAAQCSGDCVTNFGRGVLVAARVGFRFPHRFSLAIEGAYLNAAQSFWGRPSQVLTTGYPDPNDGRANDAISLRAFRVGLAPAIRLAPQSQFWLRLGVGTMLGNVTDSRSGTFSNTNTIHQYAYVVDESAAAPFRSLYLAPEITMNMALGRGFSMFPHFGAMMWVTPTAPRWATANALFWADDEGQGRFSDDQLMGPFAWMMNIGLGLHWEP